MAYYLETSLRSTIRTLYLSIFKNIFFVFRENTLKIWFSWKNSAFLSSTSQFTAKQNIHWASKFILHLRNSFSLCQKTSIIHSDECRSVFTLNCSAVHCTSAPLGPGWPLVPGKPPKPEGPLSPWGPLIPAAPWIPWNKIRKKDFLTMKRHRDLSESYSTRDVKGIV